MKTYVSNNCGNLNFFFKEQREYDHPFIGCLFVNDVEYLKFCKNFDKYIKKTPIFKSPNKNSIFAKQSGSKWYQHDEIKVGYPVMYLSSPKLGDVEIHYIHETSEKELLEKFNRRRERYLKQKPQVIFMWSDADLMNNHNFIERMKLIHSFCNIGGISLYLTKYESENKILPNVFFVKEWENEGNERNKSFIPLIHFKVNRLIFYEKFIDLLQ